MGNTAESASFLRIYEDVLVSTMFLVCSSSNQISQHNNYSALRERLFSRFFYAL